MFKRICHIGIVMPTMEACEAFMKQYGLEVFRVGETPYDTTCVFTKAREKESPIEFLIPRSGPLAAFNGGKGGIHHICYEVDSVTETANTLRSMGIKLLHEETVPTELGANINFVRPGSSFGVLVELMENSPT